VLVVGDNVNDRWNLAWALHEAGIAAEQVTDVCQARDRVSHGRLAGVILDSSTDPTLVEELTNELHPNPQSGEVPFILVAPRATTTEGVVARVRVLLQNSGQLQL
jgi:DNA-binding NtrC family response regulator